MVKYKVKDPLLWIVIVFGFGIFMFSKFYKSLPVSNLTNVKIVQSVIDVGTIEAINIKNVKFTIKNMSPNKLIIQRLEPDCYCTTAIIDSSYTNDKNEIYIIASYNNEFPGIFQKTIKVFMNTRDSPKILIFRGRVLSK